MSNTYDKILRLKLEGYKNIEIAKSLCISKSTVTYHLNEESKEGTRRRRRRNRRLSMDRLKNDNGGACKICGYNKCLNALDFHHLDPKTKDKTYSGMSSILFNCSMKKAREEAKKCILICSNCHREVHAGVTVI